MGSPQLEDGYTRIANEFLEFLMTINLSSYQRRILDVIIRNTWGFGKKEDAISVSQFQYMTGLDRRHIQRTRQQLITMNAIAYKGARQVGSYSINKHYNTWKLAPIKAIAPIEAIGTSAHIGYGSSAYTGAHKRKKEIYKEIISPQIENLLVSFNGHQEKVKEYLNEIALKNKSKKISDSRKRTALLELFNSRQRCADDAIFFKALDGSLKYHACNIGYINAIIKNQKTKVIEK